MNEPGARLRLFLTALGVVVVYSVVGYMMLGVGFWEAAHRTVLVLTTVGYIPSGFPSLAERVFTATVALSGVVVFLAALAVAGIQIAEGQFGLVRRRRRMQRAMTKMSDHYILCAYGRVGRAVAREFEAEGVPFVVIDRLDDLEDLMRYDGTTYVVADPTHEKVLREAGIDRARGLVSAVDSDADNVYITLTARSLQPDLFIVARASEPAAASRLYRAGANRVISPYVSSGRHMAMAALRPGVVDYLDIEGRDDQNLRLEEVVIEEDSPWNGATVQQVAHAATALVLRREDGTVIPSPSGEQILASGDMIVVLGDPATLRGLEQSR